LKNIPILFSAPMVRALLADTKTQTRRVFKVPKGLAWYTSGALRGEETGDLHDIAGPSWCSIDELSCPYGQPGDRLWVRETYFAWGRWETRYSVKKGRDEWHFLDMTTECGQLYLYQADGISDTQAFIKRRSDQGPMYWKRPAIFMPRAASRITLEITGVRVERLQDISEADAMAEGIFPHLRGGWHWLKHDPSNLDDWNQLGFKTAALAYQALWEPINGAGSVEANPWVWVVEFKRLEQAT